MRWKRFGLGDGNFLFFFCLLVESTDQFFVNNLDILVDRTIVSDDDIAYSPEFNGQLVEEIAEEIAEELSDNSGWPDLVFLNQLCWISGDSVRCAHCLWRHAFFSLSDERSY